MKMNKTQRRQRIQKRFRDTVLGTADTPRMSIFRSNKEIYAQIVNDETGATLAASSSRDKDFAEHSGTKVELAQKVGKAIAEKAKAAGVSAIRFDRGGYLYHGRVKSLADGAREAGLKF
ncbi:MAG: 50S ribosomal protein L18 [Flavobacteriaceae bacterium]|nr:50S ribosomal protein L18 [Flavobacteriaceae bacterium]